MIDPLSKRFFFSLLIIAISGVIVYTYLYEVSQDTRNFNFSFRQQEIDFNAQIRPIFNNKCITCHGGVKQSGGFSLLFREEALKPNESGKPAIVPGKPEKSEMISRIKHHDPEFRMPLEEEKLSEEEIDLLTAWIEQGAQWQDHWAFVKPEPIDVPEQTTGWGNNKIDHFILRKLERNNLEPSSKADKATLLRRVSLDLIGLPPTTENLQEFLKDESLQAYEKVVDRLLDSPHFGERWAAVWMDLARYADSKGYEKDLPRNIWQYRDWLIKSYNEDKPYNQFIIEQLAGDLLPNPTDEKLIATAFHRNTMNNDEGGTDNEEFRVAAVIDRVNTTWNALQATTMECVQCHSHPYDPIRHEDYYKSYAFFNNTADEDLPDDYPKLLTFTSDVDQESLESIETWIFDNTSLADEAVRKAADFAKLVKLNEPRIRSGSFVDPLENDIVFINSRILAGKNGGYSILKSFTLTKENQLIIRYKTGESVGKVEVRMDSLTGEALGTLHLKEVKNAGNFKTTAIPIKPVSGKHDLYFVFKGSGTKGYICSINWVLFYEGLPGKNQPGYGEINQELLSLLNSKEAISTPVMVELKDYNKRKTHVFERGNWMVHGEEVDPGVPEAWNAWPEDAPLNRLGMAEWLVSKENPLTARVMVNRLWAQLYGTGIVETQEDFGSQGAAPSHPQLLDWLAQQFMYQHNWSIKKQLRQLVMSATYQQSSKVTQELQEKDPKNRLLARGPRIRLTAEQVRDQALAVSGLLSKKMYGPSVMPYQPEGVWNSVYNNLTWETSEGEDKYRRALYTFIRRTSPYPSMITFDSPSREYCVVRRINTNTPLQALITLNDPVYMEAAKALAHLMKNSGQVEEQIKIGYQRAMGKEIDSEKLYDLQLLYEEALHHFKGDQQAAKDITGNKKEIELAALTVVARAIINLDEFITKS